MSRAKMRKKHYKHCEENGLLWQDEIRGMSSAATFVYCVITDL